MRRQVRPTATPAKLPAPMGGLNTSAAGTSLPPGDCSVVWNMLAAENGLRVRYGWREQCTGLTGSGDNTVRTVMPFTGSGSVKLFATTNTGIWDVTDQSSSPTQVVTFTSNVANAGYGVSTVVAVAGGYYLLYADEENGLYTYAETGATWTKVASGTGAGQISGVNPAQLAFVTEFKGRVWFATKASASAWYLPAGAIAGAASEFPLGMSFHRGGTVLGLWSWTYDGGSGVDDSLVVMSTNGDVVIYQGTDPASASTFSRKGVWYAGPPPAGRMVATSEGGELRLLTRKGVVPMSKLVMGANLLLESDTAKISSYVNALMSSRGNFRGWAMLSHPDDAAFLVLVPRGSTDYAMQLAQSTATRGWFPWRGLDMTCACAWTGALYFGTSDGRVCINSGTVDAVILSDPNSFSAIDWSFVSAASDLGSPTQKQVGLVRPLLISDGIAPSFEAEARYGYSQDEVDPVALAAGANSGWDSDLWDVATWAGDTAPVQVVRGTTGIGSLVALAMRGAAVSKTIFLGADVTYTSGGFL